MKKIMSSSQNGKGRGPAREDIGNGGGLENKDAKAAYSLKHKI
jgi:hypothetical protein